MTLLSNELQRFKLILGNVYDEAEADNITRLVFEEIFKIPPHQQRVDSEKAINPEEISLIRSILGRLLLQEPIQYILGFAWFMDRRFMVNTSTLIPRPETEELVAWVVKENRQIASILDLGTGSGCIAICLAQALPNASVTGIDISKGAIIAAKMNAQKILENDDSNIHFEEGDLFSETWWDQQGTFDVIVSNPPYVLEKEKLGMSNHVLGYEPASALFVPDHDPLLYYRIIGERAVKHLNPGGSLYLEINSALGQETCDLLHSMGYTTILKQDMQGKDRMVKAQRG